MQTEMHIPQASARPRHREIGAAKAHDDSATGRASLSDILWRFSWPFCFFCFLLAMLMTVSWTLLLPRYTKVKIGGELRNTSQIIAYRATLEAKISSQESERRRLVLAVHDPQYDDLKAGRLGRVPLDELRSRLTEHAVKIAARNDVVLWNSFAYDPEEKMLRIRGSIGNVGVRSMTVLAEFAQSLKSLPFIAKVTTPRFMREEDHKTGFRSPFDITITLN